ncbi:hypothetical protein OJAV_G00011750 [Oryzias javanicus]|uniref:Uncharacterized protein n=1 Tax=Oryzias javanicus TaxID=123683 RepID=A0A437DP10_ORYJA|nr:hypothetical protein OJAV_G00011750 [Oryzias javanicus]
MFSGGKAVNVQLPLQEIFWFLRPTEAARRGHTSDSWRWAEPRRRSPTSFQEKISNSRVLSFSIKQPGNISGAFSPVDGDHPSAGAAGATRRSRRENGTQRLSVFIPGNPEEQNAADSRAFVCGGPRWALCNPKL